MKKFDELKLIARCVLTDDREAFGQLVEAYQPQVRRFLMNLTCGDASLTDDLAQETFIKAYLNVRNFKGLATFKTWLYRIAYNEFYSEVRRRHEVASLEIDDTPLTPIDNSAETCDVKLTVQAAIAQLNDVERVVVTLRHIEEQPIKKIADIMQLPENTVKSHLHRARGRLQQLLGS
ncbi:MAG: RNA polymerase sigma factor [Muribaculaceae bacterium]|nr:RNA polymerase sigma factor [Muribaculaceae bacterium]MBQ2236020.1 RNA polymerase sigma factor [Muribaculaceae bacterium]